MGNTTNRAKGKLEELAGKAKQQIAKSTERTTGALEQVAGSAKKRVGGLIKNQQMQAEGKLKELKGSVRARIHR